MKLRDILMRSAAQRPISRRIAIGRGQRTTFTLWREQWKSHFGKDAKYVKPYGTRPANKRNQGFQPWTPRAKTT